MTQETLEQQMEREDRLRTAQRGARLYREALMRAGVNPPIREEYADAWDPPLTAAETRHYVHESIGGVEGCRFCPEAR